MPKNKSYKSELTKQKLIQNAHLLFHKQGFDKTTVQQITTNAGVAKGTFYLYFETKFDILSYITLEMLDELVEIMSKIVNCNKTNYKDKLKNFFDTIFLTIETNKCCIELFHTEEFLKLLTHDKYTSDFFLSLEVLTRQYILEGKEDGFFRDLDEVFYAKYITLTCHNLIESSYLRGYPSNPQQLKEELFHIILRILEK